MEVYVDVVVFENFLIDLFLLLLTVKVLRYSYKPLNLYLASFIGGVYALSVFSNLHFLSNFFVKASVAVIMVCITINDRSFLNIFKCSVVLFMLAFLLCGVCFGIAESKEVYYISDDFQIKSYSIKWVIFSLLLLYIVVVRISDHLRERAVVKNFIYDVYISLGDSSISIKGFLDTGNELRETATNLPCIIIEDRYLNRLNLNYGAKYVIQYKTISNDNCIYGFKCDEVKIRGENEKTWRNINAIVCSCKVKLSKENEFQALLSRGII